MDISTNENKKRIIKKHSPHSPILKNCILSFVFGGSICAFGELLFMFYYSFLNDKKLSVTLVTVTVIAAASMLTALGVFDTVAKHAGAGTLVPVSGFSNAVTSIALDSKS